VYFKVLFRIGADSTFLINFLRNFVLSDDVYGVNLLRHSHDRWGLVVVHSFFWRRLVVAGDEEVLASQAHLHLVKHTVRSFIGGWLRPERIQIYLADLNVQLLVFEVTVFQ